VTGFGIATFGRFGDSTSAIGGMTRRDPFACRPGFENPVIRSETTKVIGGALLAIRLIAGSHSPLEITFSSIVSGSGEIVSVIRTGLRKFGTRVCCRYDRLFPTASLLQAR